MYYCRGVAYIDLGEFDLAITDYRYACDNGQKEACRALKKLTGGE